MKKYLLRLVISIGSLVLLTHTANAQWVQTYGPSKDIRAVAVSDNTAFAGTNDGCVFSSGYSEYYFLSCFKISSWVKSLLSPQIQVRFAEYLLGTWVVIMTLMPGFLVDNSGYGFPFLRSIAIRMAFFRRTGFSYYFPHNRKGIRLKKWNVMAAHRKHPRLASFENC